MEARRRPTIGRLEAGRSGRRPAKEALLLSDIFIDMQIMRHHDGKTPQVGGLVVSHHQPSHRHHHHHHPHHHHHTAIILQIKLENPTVAR